MKSKIAIKITLIYFSIGFLWILFSDRVIRGIASNPESLSHLQTYKGWFYVAVTALLLYLLIRYEIRQQELIMAELKKAKTKAEETDQLKSAFLSNMSHEIRTPLNGILGFCELILDNSYTKEEKHIFANNLTKNSKDLIKLINDIMDISRIQENQFNISKKIFNLNHLLESLYQDNQNSDLKQIREQISFQLIKDLPDVETDIYSDPDRLKIILQNLLNNALFFTKEGFVCFGYEKTDSGIVIFVEDSGCGIDESNQDLIFKPFFKGTNMVAGSKGFGLGLAISRGLVRLLGSDLFFRSIKGKGTKFFFELKHSNIKLPEGNDEIKPSKRILRTINSVE